VAELDRELQRFGGIAELTAAREARAGGLELEICRLEGEVKALKEERKGLEGGVQAIKDQTVSEIQRVGKQVARELRRSGKEARAEIDFLSQAAAEYAQLKEESATLKDYLLIARSLRSDASQVWRGMSRTVIQHLLLGVATWAQEEGRNPRLPPPAVVKQSLLMPSWTSLSLSHLLLWALSGVYTPEERQALSTRG
jgi:hypothetical protein